MGLADLTYDGKLSRGELFDQGRSASIATGQNGLGFKVDQGLPSAKCLSVSSIGFDQAVNRTVVANAHVGHNELAGLIQSCLHSLQETPLNFRVINRVQNKDNRRCVKFPIVRKTFDSSFYELNRTTIACPLGHCPRLPQVICGRIDDCQIGEDVPFGEKLNFSPSPASDYQYFAMRLAQGSKSIANRLIEIFQPWHGCLKSSVVG